MNLLHDLKRLTYAKRSVQVIEQRIVTTLNQLLPSIGYRIVPSDNGQAPSGPFSVQMRIPLSVKRANGKARGKPKSKRQLTLKCPKCDRRFSHPLPMSRHVAAIHRKKAKASR